jgi:antitoxin component YwqK of YwqJK toxin-antitoxin module
VKALEVKTTYPEYHRLLADKKVDLFIFFNEVSGEEKPASEALKKKLERLGYRAESTNAPYHFLYRKNIDGITLNIEWSVGYEGRPLFVSAIKTHEIVIYDGHAGYGANIDNHFNKEDSFPDSQYQIFILNGCATYKYGMSQLLNVKALKDFDFYHQNIDVVTTYTSVSGHRQNDVIIEALEKAIPAYRKAAMDEGTKEVFKNQLSWLAIITKFNQVSDEYSRDNGIFMVSGEEDNDYEPGKTSFPGMKQYSADELLELIHDAGQQEKSRIMALRAYMKYHVMKSDDTRVEDVLERTEQFCKANKQEAATVFAAAFYLPGCQIRQLHLNKDMPYQGVTLDATKDVIFYSTGKLQKAQLKESATIDGMSVTSGHYTYFYESGKLKHFRSDRVFKDKAGREFSPFDYISLYESGALKRGTLNGETPLQFRNLTIRNNQVEFYEDGELKAATLFTDATLPLSYQGFSFLGYGMLSLYPDGRLMSINSSKLNYEDRSLILHEGASVYLFPNGNPRFIALNYADEADRAQKSFTYKDVKYQQIMLREDGSLAMAQFADKKKLTGRMPCDTVGEDASVFFDTKGTLVGCKLADDFSIEGRQFARGTMVIWTADGRVIDVTEESNALAYLASIGIDFDSLFRNEYEELWEN